MSRLYNYFLNCWVNGTATDTTLANAVSKGYITADEKTQIEATPQSN